MSMIVKCDFCGKEFNKPANKVRESKKKRMENILF